MTTKELFKEKCIIGMVHCLPLPGTLNYSGSMDPIYEQAIADARALEAGGVTALIVENQHDVPAPIALSHEQIAALAAVASRVREAVDIPIGIDAAFCDWKAAIAIAVAVKADFIRLAVFVDQVMTASGVVDPCCVDAVRYRKQLGADGLLFLCDAQVKHSYMTVGSIPVTASAKMAEDNGADAIIVTGTTTGEAAPVEIIKEVRKTVKLPLLVGSGFNAANAAQQLPYIDGAIVGSALKRDGVIIKPVDIERVKTLMETVKNYKQ